MHDISRILALAAIAASFTGCAETRLALAVPERAPVIKRAKMIIEIAGLQTSTGEYSDIPASFDIHDPAGNVPTVLTPGGSFGGLKFGMGPVTGELPTGDIVVVRPPTHTDATDPKRLRFQIDFSLISDYNGATCNALPPPTTETWNILITSAVVRKVCVITEVATQPCAADPVITDDAPFATVSVVSPTTGDAAPTVITTADCGDLRP